MHMSDALVSPAVGITMLVVSAGLIGLSAYKGRKTMDRKTIPMMGVMAALIFAGQMINFTIPVTGSSGHIGGGILLAAMLGEGPGMMALSAVLLIQAFFFADGGLLALGCNIFNMGVWPCLVIFPLIFRPMLKKKISNGRIMAASVISVIIALQLGAFSVVMETLLSGVTALPFKEFVILMQPIHLAIGAVEGIVTGLILIFVHNIRPEILDHTVKGSSVQGVSTKKLIIILIILAVIIAGGLSLFASTNPDGLEWAIGHITNEEALGNGYDVLNSIQDKTSVLPDYGFKDSDTASGTSFSGLIGGIIVLVLAIAAGAVITITKKNKNKE